MDITFLIGNGFDLMMGLKTDYSRFLEYYLDKPSDEKICIEKFKEQIEANIQTWSNAEIALGRYTSSFTQNEASDFMQCNADFCLNLATYLKLQDESLDVGDLSSILTPIFKKAILEFHTFLLPKPKKDITALFTRNRQDHRIYNFINFNYTSLFDRCVSLVAPEDRIIQSRTEGSNKYQDRLGSIIHIHGTTTNKLIMGVNDESQIANSEFLSIRKLKRTLIKPLTNEANHLGNDEDCLQLINNSRIIIVYGMSIGVTDNIWWERIASWLLVNKERFLILFIYKPDYNDIIQNKYLEEEEEVENLFFNNAKVKPEVQDQLRPQIFINFNMSLFGDTPKKTK